MVSLENHANTSAATIPLALTKAVNNNQFKSNDTIALTAMGAGFSWGSCILKWK
ncbi:MAG: 3-oxoacyl-[acyl-carrier-protein] synthase III C-terminal domain-containing protein [Alphaproteobacteria bacterium]